MPSHLPLNSSASFSTVTRDDASRCAFAAPAPAGLRPPCQEGKGHISLRGQSHHQRRLLCSRPAEKRMEQHSANRNQPLRRADRGKHQNDGVIRQCVCLEYL